MILTDRHNYVTLIENIGTVPSQNITQVHKNRPSCGLVYYAEGENEFMFEDHTVKISAGKVLYIPEGASYRVHKREHTFCIAVNFKMNHIIPKDFICTPKNPSKIENIFVNTEIIWRTKPAGYYSKCMANIYNIFAALENDAQANYIPTSRAAKLQPAIDYIHKNYATEKISIEHLASLTEMSTTYFRKIFKQLYAVSPVTYINNLKIQRAKEALRSQLYTVEQVAALAGYNDPSFFRREFKHYTDMTPTEYVGKHK